jgi:hypothetical protein
MSSIFVPTNSSLLGATGIINPNVGSSNGVSSSELADVKNQISSLREAMNSSAVANDVDELKKFTEFLKFRIDGLDARLAAIEKTNGDLNSKMNIMEITITALSAVLKKPAAE